MTEQDKDLKQLFEYFSPELNDTDSFMKKLENRLDGVEFIRESSRKTLRNYRHAIIAACVAGFVSGALMTVLFPHLVALVSSFPRLTDYSNIVAWILAAAITCVITFTAYTRTIKS